jgi:UDP-N-acetyl-D-glucosamine dehydrogenase
LDIAPETIEAWRQGETRADAVPADVIALRESGRLQPSTDFDLLHECDAVVICVPTPLTPAREPDLSFVASATRAIVARLHPGQLVVLESTTYPGTTQELLQPLLEEGGLRVGEDIALAFSPERIDPGNEQFPIERVPKVIGGVTPTCSEAALLLYGAICGTCVPVSSPRAAEMTKLLENVFRSVNIALVNELAMLCDRMNLDVWEVVEAAKTKPYGFTAFYPGPGLGGHCIPVDPFYLAWKAHEYGFETRFIELAGEVNRAMPEWVVERVVRALNDERKALNGSRIGLLGVAYKPDVGDCRESPALEIAKLLRERGAEVCYHDPYVPQARIGKEMLESQPIEAILDADCLVLLTHHRALPYDMIAARARVILDTRNAFAWIENPTARVVKL